MDRVNNNGISGKGGSDTEGSPVADHEEILAFYTSVLRDDVVPTHGRKPPAATLRERMTAAGALTRMLGPPVRDKPALTLLDQEIEAEARRIAEADDAG